MAPLELLQALEQLTPAERVQPRSRGLPPNLENRPLRNVTKGTRFSKYAGSLFEFLRHDNVPWNNNNAEHAVHYFGKVRRFTDGTFTSSSIEELLTLVTVLQTCEYSGINPLQFLLSGETSLEAMTTWRERHKACPLPN